MSVARILRGHPPHRCSHLTPMAIVWNCTVSAWRRHSPAAALRLLLLAFAVAMTPPAAPCQSPGVVRVEGFAGWQIQLTSPAIGSDTATVSVAPGSFTVPGGRTFVAVTAGTPLQI